MAGILQSEPRYGLFLQFFFNRKPDLFKDVRLLLGAIPVHHVNGILGGLNEGTVFLFALPQCLFSQHSLCDIAQRCYPNLTALATNYLALNFGREGGAPSFRNAMAS